MTAIKGSHDLLHWRRRSRLRPTPRVLPPTHRISADLANQAVAPPSQNAPVRATPKPRSGGADGVRQAVLRGDRRRQPHARQRLRKAYTAESVQKRHERVGRAVENRAGIRKLCSTACRTWCCSAAASSSKSVMRWSARSARRARPAPTSTMLCARPATKKSRTSSNSAASTGFSRRPWRRAPGRNRAARRRSCGAGDGRNRRGTDRG